MYQGWTGAAVQSRLTTLIHTHTAHLTHHTPHTPHTTHLTHHTPHTGEVDSSEDGVMGGEYEVAGDVTQVAPRPDAGALVEQITYLTSWPQTTPPVSVSVCVCECVCVRVCVCECVCV